MTNKEALDEVFNFIPKSILEQIKEEGGYDAILKGKAKSGAEVYDYIDEQHASLQDADYTTLAEILSEHFNNGSVLQIGCGRGDLLMRCADLGYSPVYGIDRSKTMLNEAKYRFKDNDNSKLFVKRVENFNFSDLNQIENVIINNFWGMIDRNTSINLLNNLKQCLTPNAKIFIGTYNEGEVPKKRQLADKTLKDNLGFIFSYGFYKDFDNCGFISKTLNIFNEKYFILTQK